MTTLARLTRLLTAPFRWFDQLAALLLCLVGSHDMQMDYRPFRQRVVRCWRCGKVSDEH